MLINLALYVFSEEPKKRIYTINNSGITALEAVP